MFQTISSPPVPQHTPKIQIPMVILPTTPLEFCLFGGLLSPGPLGGVADTAPFPGCADRPQSRTRKQLCTGQESLLVSMRPRPQSLCKDVSLQCCAAGQNLGVWVSVPQALLPPKPLAPSPTVPTCSAEGSCRA